MEIVRSAVQQEPYKKAGDGAIDGSFLDVSVSRKTDGWPVTKVEADQMEKAVDQANGLAVMFGRNLKFEYRSEADRYQISVIDTAKGEVVRKIPPDEVIRFMENVKNLFGALIDLKA